MRTREWPLFTGVGVGWLLLYHNVIAPIVVDRYAACHFAKDEGPVTRTFQWMFSDQCVWRPEHASLILPGIAVGGSILLFMVVRFILDWDGRPPDWACQLAGFGFGAIVAATAGAALAVAYFAVVGPYSRRHPTNATVPGDVQVLLFIVTGLVFLGGPIFMIWLWIRAAHAIEPALRGQAANGPLAFAGSVVGVTVGAGVTALVFVAAFFVLLAFAAYLAVSFLIGSVVLGSILK